MQPLQATQLTDGQTAGSSRSHVKAGAIATTAGAATADSKSAAQIQDQAVLMSQPCLKNVEFLENLRNPRNLQPLSLPVQLKLFTRIPVVISARLFGQTGKPSEVFARLLIS